MKNKAKKEQTASASKYPQGYFKPKPCKGCKTSFTPKAPSECYCSDECKDVGLTNAYLKRTYAITVADYKMMFDEQSGVCKICSSSGFVMAKHHKMKLVVDHCHTTGQVRGLLCHNCNRALGLLRDSVPNLEASIAYLQHSTPKLIKTPHTPTKLI